MKLCANISREKQRNVVSLKSDRNPLKAKFSRNPNIEQSFGIENLVRREKIF